MIESYTGGNIFEPGGLDANRTYYWRVDAVQQDGQVLEGEVWSFNTNAGGSDTGYINWRNGAFTGAEIASGIADESDDPDADGLTNYEEFIANTLPKDNNSLFRAWASKGTGPVIDVNFHPVGADRLYRVLGSDNLTDWTVETISQADLADGTAQLGIGMDDRRFYRVEAVR
jgi:hypothetical protein